MKKRILLTMLFVIAFSLLAVLSVSAEDYTLVDNLGDPDWYTGNYELMTDKESQVVLSNGDGTYTAYPSYYILKYSISVSGGVVTEAYINDKKCRKTNKCSMKNNCIHRNLFNKILHEKSNYRIRNSRNYR